MKLFFECRFRNNGIQIENLQDEVMRSRKFAMMSLNQFSKDGFFKLIAESIENNKLFDGMVMIIFDAAYLAYCELCNDKKLWEMDDYKFKKYMRKEIFKKFNKKDEDEAKRIRNYYICKIFQKELKIVVHNVFHVLELNKWDKFEKMKNFGDMDDKMKASIKKKGFITCEIYTDLLNNFVYEMTGKQAKSNVFKELANVDEKNTKTRWHK